MTRFTSIFISLILMGTTSIQSQIPLPTTNNAIESKINGMIVKMSLDDKLALLGGEDDFYTKAIPAIGLKRLKMSDGPVGVRTFGPATAYAASIGLAASWDPELAVRVGKALGEDARARGINFLLAPGVNIYRSPLNGRNMEYFGEDPYLAGRIAVGYIDGLQSMGISATVKHFAANNSEYDRHNIDAIIDERTLRELYLPAFEAAVTRAHVGAVMNSYNLVNGQHATQSRHLNNDILKGEWNFQGVLMSDWNSTYDGIEAAKNGLDLEMPFAKFMTPSTLKQALDTGELNEQVIDDKVRRILRIALRFGWLDHDQTDTSIPLYNLNSDQVALEEARESITLLKNRGGLLPLDTTKMKTIAILGPEAATAVVGGGGSSKTTPFEAQSFVAGFASYLGNRVKVMYALGMPTLNDLFHETNFRSLTLETRIGGKNSSATISHPGSNINLWHNDDKVDEPGTEAQTTTNYQWRGRYVPSTSGEYLLVVSARNDDTYQVSVNEKIVLRHPPQRVMQTTETCIVNLIADKISDISVEYETSSRTPRFGVGLHLRSDLLPHSSQKIVQNADAVLLAVGLDPATESESYDRPYVMPFLQNELISTVAAINPKTIVTVTAGGTVDAQTWIGQIPALLHNYYPGQEGARALAEIIFGERSPEGHLPFSWEFTLADNPTSAHYEEENDKKESHYEEGLYVGYRYYTSMNKHPLFPFGLGLSYTSFAYSNLVVVRNSDDDVEVSFDVENTGGRKGATVAQLYVSDPSASVKRPVQELKQFVKVRLEAGERRHTILHLDRRAFEYYDVPGRQWKLDPGIFKVMIGESSEGITLRGNVNMR